MNNAEPVEIDHMPKAGRIAEYTIEYLDARKEAERKERRSGRNWVRTLYYLPYMLSMIFTPKLQILWPYKFCIDLIGFAISVVLYTRSFDRAVMQRLNNELRARAD